MCSVAECSPYLPRPLGKVQMCRGRCPDKGIESPRPMPCPVLDLGIYQIARPGGKNERGHAIAVVPGGEVSSPTVDVYIDTISSFPASLDRQRTQWRG